MESKPGQSSCSICHAAPPKYRCPRCPQVRTCSLPCYKRHQQRASCTGQRNPTTYLKKSQVATAAVVDHDYNFLTGIERALEHGAHVADPGAGDAPPSFKKRKFGPEGLVARHLVENGITVEMAPRELHRSRINNTRFLRKVRKVAWTVEWIDEGGRVIMDEILDDSTLEKAWSVLVKREGRKVKQRQGNATGYTALGSTSAASGDLSARNLLQSNGTQDALQDHRDEDEDEEQEEIQEATKGAEATESNETVLADPASPPQRTGLEAVEGKGNNSAAVHFYLHVPHHAGRAKALAHIPTTQTLAETLKGRVLLEFPTIYHLPHPPDALPQGFVLATTTTTTMTTSATPAANVQAATTGAPGSSTGNDGAAAASPPPTPASGAATSALTADGGSPEDEMTPRDMVAGNASGFPSPPRGTQESAWPARGRGHGHGHGRARDGWGDRGTGRGGRGAGGRGGSSFRGRGGWDGRGTGRGRGRGQQHWRGSGGGGSSSSHGGAGPGGEQERARLAEQAAAAAAADKRRILDLLRRDVAAS